MKVGYARVSSLGQSLDTQIEKLTAFGCEKIFQEKRSGATREKREAVNAALEFCREGAPPLSGMLSAALFFSNFQVGGLGQ
jgi:DNA invertase Pin-like site-specific DNA recombinase